VGLRHACDRVRPRLRPPRRRLRLDRRQRRPPERIQLRLRQRHLDLQPAEEDPEEPERRAGVARPRDGAGGEGAHAGGGRRAAALLGAAPEGPDRAAGAGDAVLDAREQLRDRLLDGAGPGVRPGPSGRRLRAAFDDAVRQGVRRSERAPGPDRSGRPVALVDRTEHRVHELSAGSEERRDDLPEADRAGPERRDDPDPAGPGRAGGQRQRHGDRRLQEVPEARPERPARTAGEAGAEVTSGLGGCLVLRFQRRLDSRGNRAGVPPMRGDR